MDITTFPDDALEKIEFTKILDEVKKVCISPSAQSYFDQIKATDDFNQIIQWLNETEEFKKSIIRGEHIPIHYFDSIDQDIPLLKKEGYVLSIDAIARVYTIVHGGNELTKYFEDQEKRQLNPLLSKICDSIMLDATLVKEIDRVLDAYGEVKPNASEELLKIFRGIKNKEKEIDKIFRQELEFYKAKGFLTESFESIRNERRVLMVAAEYKRQINGIIHDESATGKTVFVEPTHVISHNNDLYNLFSEKRSEIYRILRTLSSFIRPFADQILSVQHILTRIDVIRAKAIFAKKINASRPYIQQKPLFDYKEAYNPLLVIKSLENTQFDVIPFDLTLLGENRILILSGPNAGGKSVALKSVGLLQYMAQCGMLITCNENSQIGIFKSIYVDIGDHQSIEDDLSTYSSHLQAMKYITEKANDQSLILFDEFGAGTDPKIGGAIAEAVLHTLNQLNVHGVITTHYSNLKFFAFKRKGIVNGAMTFDRQHLSPTYRLQVGKPGSSFAFEIAQKIGLSEKIIDYARHKTGKNEKAVDDMLISLMDEKQEYEKKFESLIDKQDKLDRLMASYELLNKDLEIKKKKIKLQVKEKAYQELYEKQKQLQSIIKQARHDIVSTQMQNIENIIKEEQSKVEKDLTNLKHQVFEDQISIAPEKMNIGAFVRMRNGATIGKIVHIHKDIAEIEMGLMHVKVPLIELEAASAPKTSSTPVRTQLQSNVHDKFDTTLDIREYTKDEGKKLVQQFIDNALLHNAFELKIIHGVGTGVMRKEVQKILKEYRDIKRYWHPEPDAGGEGVTLVQL